MTARVLACFAVVAFVPFVSADDADAKKTVKGLVEKMQAATLKDDYEAVIDLTHPKAIEQLGGREKAITVIKTAMKGIKDKGITIKSLKAGEPADPVRAGKELYTVVPTTMELTTPQGKLAASGFVVGVSSDAGKTWRFVDGAPGPDEVRRMLPDLPEKLTLPKAEYKLIKD